MLQIPICIENNDLAFVFYPLLHFYDLIIHYFVVGFHFNHFHFRKNACLSKKTARVTTDSGVSMRKLMHLKDCPQMGCLLWVMHGHYPIKKGPLWFFCLTKRFLGWHAIRNRSLQKDRLSIVFWLLWDWNTNYFGSSWPHVFYYLGAKRQSLPSHLGMGFNLFCSWKESTIEIMTFDASEFPLRIYCTRKWNLFLTLRWDSKRTRKNILHKKLQIYCKKTYSSQYEKH